MQQATMVYYDRVNDDVRSCATQTLAVINDHEVFLADARLE
jgi:hypothetical protein